MKLLVPIKITVTKDTLTLQKGNTHKVKNKMAYEILKAMLMHSQAMTFYSADTYEDMCSLLGAVIFSDLNK